jgi:hypothetical protein
VPGNRSWTDTGIPLDEGSSISLRASGKIEVVEGDPGTTPAGNPDCVRPDGQHFNKDIGEWVAPSLDCWSLIGKVGEYGEAFVVGTGVDNKSVQTSGSLYLGVNDHTHLFEDNSGSWTVVYLGNAGPDSPASQTAPQRTTVVSLGSGPRPTTYPGYLTSEIGLEVTPRGR